MAVRPGVYRSPDVPAGATCVESSGDLGGVTSADRQPKMGSVDSFPGLCSPMRSSGSQSTILDQPTLDKAKPRAGPSIKASKPRLRGAPPPAKPLSDFWWSLFHNGSYSAYQSFLSVYPEYKLTRPIDTLRQREYKRLKRSDGVYMDYMGASLYPESLIRSDATFLRQVVLGNTHSLSAR